MNDTTKAIIAGLVRHGIGVIGAYLLAGGWGVALSSQQMDTLTGAVMIVIAIIWSIVHKMMVQPNVTARATAVASAVRSVAIGVPVTVAVVEKTPAGIPDQGEATLIPPAEMALATTVPVGLAPQPAPAP